MGWLQENATGLPDLHRWNFFLCTMLHSTGTEAVPIPVIAAYRYYTLHGDMVENNTVTWNQKFKEFNRSFSYDKREELAEKWNLVLDRRGENPWGQWKTLKSNFINDLPEEVISYVKDIPFIQPLDRYLSADLTQRGLSTNQQDYLQIQYATYVYGEISYIRFIELLLEKDICIYMDGSYGAIGVSFLESIKIPKLTVDLINRGTETITLNHQNFPTDVLRGIRRGYILLDDTYIPGEDWRSKVNEANIKAFTFQTDKVLQFAKQCGLTIRNGEWVVIHSPY